MIDMGGTRLDSTCLEVKFGSQQRPSSQLQGILFLCRQCAVQQ